jgi:hypothetical protein
MERVEQKMRIDLRSQRDELRLLREERRRASAAAASSARNRRCPRMA